MAGILNTSLSGMLAFQRALDVTGHNIANANTPGYSRQVANFTARPGTGSGVGYIGSGTQIASIERIYDAMQTDQLRSTTTGYARLNTLTSLSNRIDTLLADPSTGLTAGLQGYFGAMQDLANDPSSIPTRRALVVEAEGVAARFQSLDDRFVELDGEVNSRIELAVADINRLASSIATVNSKIALANNSASPPNDLLDERDGLVLQLSAQVAIATNIQDDGTMSVFIGSGQSLVLGGGARQLGVSGSEFDRTRMTVNYVSAAGSTPLDTTSTGGNLGGLLDYRSNVLDPARQSLGQTAVAFAGSLNEQHAAGMDMRGNLGGDLFTLASPGVLPSANNVGNGTASADITDLGTYTGSDYVLNFDGSNYSLIRNDTKAAVAMTGSGTALDPFVADGLSMVVGGSAAAGDQLLIRSGQGMAGNIQSAISDPQAIAIAAPTRSVASLGNIGDANISRASVADPADPNLLTGAVIDFTSATTYSIDGVGSFAYVDGTPITINGSNVTISGVPSTGDQFSIEANNGASGDNANALILANIQSVGVLDGGTISINQSYGGLVADVGATTHQLQSNREAQGVILQNAEDAVLSTSAVNLDEEAANLIKYQQAYQAIAQVIGIANTLFDSLLNATRR